MSTKKILVIGDSCLDLFIYGPIRLSPECPTCVIKPEYKTSNPGMAANVKENLMSLRPNWGVDLITQKSKITKSRYVDKSSGYILLRVDENDKSEPLIDFDLNALSNYDLVIISDYNKGFLNKELLFDIFNYCGKKGIKTMMDTKFSLGDWSKNCFVVKINQKELDNQTSPPYGFCENLIVTLGKNGAVLYQRNDSVLFQDAAHSVEVKDLAGAGDSFLAGLAVMYLEQDEEINSETEKLKKSIKYANKVAAIAVSHNGVVAVKEEEVK